VSDGQPISKKAKAPNTATGASPTPELKKIKPNQKFSIDPNKMKCFYKTINPDAKFNQPRVPMICGAKIDNCCPSKYLLKIQSVRAGIIPNQVSAKIKNYQ
jgi:hypothetical protein